jgi:hypothetical protein
MVLEPTDEVVYNLLVGRAFAGIAEAVKPFDGEPDVSYRLADSATADEWVRSDFLIWKRWRERSLARLGEVSPYVVITDLTGYYENIDFNRLMSDLRKVNFARTDELLLSECLNRWAYPRGKGVPQGYSASDILAKLYLNDLDTVLRNEGYIHLRYVDDYRIFCSSKHAAKAAIARLSELVYHRGLNLQSGKTEILTKADARARFEGVDPIIKDVQKQLASELQEELGIPVSYLPLRKLIGHPVFLDT